MSEKQGVGRGSMCTPDPSPLQVGGEEPTEWGCLTIWCVARAGGNMHNCVDVRTRQSEILPVQGTSGPEGNITRV